MPVVDASLSDIERSPSPEYDPPARSGPSGQSGSGSSEPAPKKYMTVNDLQRRQLDKLLSNPEKEVKLPEGLGARMGGVRAPREMIKSVAGSAAAAGSGEFHVYKQSRRREAERIRHMEETNRLLEEQRAFQDRQEARDAVTDAKTAKNRAKRLKRKAGRKGGDGDDKEKGPAKSKFAAGAGGTATAGSGSKFAHPNHQEPANDDQTARTAGIASTPKFSIPASAQEQQALRDEGVASAEVQISIVDDD